jgi:DNA-binding transcriptional LysR family regulator
MFVSLQQLRCLRATAQHGSFTAAASALGLTQPGVADHVRKLERLLDVELFTRRARGVVLTEAGAAFDTHAHAALNAVDHAVRSVDDIGQLRAGTLAFGLPATPEAYAIDSFASDFALRHPGVRLRLVGRNSSTSAELVRDGELEAALVSLPIDNRNLVVQPVAADDVVFVSADRSRTTSPVTIEHLTGRPLVVYDTESGDRDPLRRQLAKRAQEIGVRLDPRIETQTMVMALRLVADGAGDTYIPRAHTRTSYFPAGLHTTRFEPPISETLAIVRRENTRPSAVVAAFADGLREHLVEYLGATSSPPS